MRRRAGCGCLGCGALLFVTFAVLTGSVGVLAGNWGGLARLAVPDPSTAVDDIPVDYLTLYQDAGRAFGLDWPVLAAVGRVESDHGRLTAGCEPNEAGAVGPMQFLPSSFTQASGWAGLAAADICDPDDAVPAAAAYLRHFGAPDDWRRALFAYNHSQAYVDLVLAWAARYGHATAVVWPLYGPITQFFGPTDFELQPPLWYRGRWYEHFHAGLDIGAPVGTPVVAIADGVVTFADQIADGAVVVEIEHAPGVTSAYAHLQPDPPVRTGQPVTADEVIGAVGLTGITTGPHLHLAVFAGGEFVDPLSVLPARIEEVPRGR
ncbi:MAG TPA: M23 family metallopeptidase [Candidatus Limnocylindrales bacterium]|nr:M23 family metallopeptidase [Candidatus Limnocylindrales bacterium]